MQHSWASQQVTSSGKRRKKPTRMMVTQLYSCNSIVPINSSWTVTILCLMMTKSTTTSTTISITIITVTSMTISPTTICCISSCRRKSGWFHHSLITFTLDHVVNLKLMSLTSSSSPPPPPPSLPPWCPYYTKKRTLNRLLSYILYTRHNIHTT